MKRSFLYFTFMLLTRSLLAQDSIVISQDELEKRGQDNFHFDISYCTFLDGPTGVDFEFYSVGMNAFLYKNLPFGESPLSFAFGAGVSSLGYHHDGRIFVDSLGNTNWNPSDTGAQLDKNKYTLVYLDVPLELRFKTRGASGFRFSVGARGGIRINDHLTLKRDDVYKVKVYKLANVMNYHYGLSAKIGFGQFALSGFYSLSDLFDSGSGPELRPLTIGLAWIPF